MFGTSSSQTFASYVRTVSLAISAYDYLQTLPFEYRISVEAWKTRRMSLSFILFMVVRYTSILVLTISNVAFFCHNFSFAVCQRYFLTPSIFKLFQAMVTQAILGVRAYNLSRKSAHVGYAIICIYLICCAFQWITTLFDRKISWNPNVRNCATIGPHGELGGWVYYAVAIVYDFSMTAFCVAFLLKLKPTSSSVMSRVSRMMLVDGLWYFIVLALANLSSLSFYRVTDSKFASMPTVAGQVQTAVASLGYCVRWVMSQKLIIHLYEASIARRNESIQNAITVGTHFTSAKTGVPGRLSLTVPSLDDDEWSVESRGGNERGESDENMREVEVRMERTVRLDSVATTRLYEVVEDYPYSRNTQGTRRR